MVKLTRIYTKTGDKGTSALANNERISKDSALFEAIGDVDEANAAIGVAMSFINNMDVLEVLFHVQNKMFDLGADLASSKLRLTQNYIDFLETQIDRFNNELEELNSFVLPSGSKASSHLHLARTVVRRAERRVWRVVNTKEANELLAVYLNRLSDLLFVMARYLNTMGDVLWTHE